MMKGLKVKDEAWWIWLGLALLLVVGLFVIRPALYLALAISAIQAVRYCMRFNGLRPYPAQVRVGYLIWMIAGFLPGLFVLHWIQAAGTFALITVGYCPMARILMFMPWNRDVPLTWQRVKVIVFHPPTVGPALTSLPL